MVRTTREENKVGAFFLATLVLWLISVVFEIVFNKRKELLCVIAGCCFFQTANWVIRSFLSPDPLFVNSSVSLLHSSITSASGVFSLMTQLLFVFPILGSSYIFNWIFPFNLFVISMLLMDYTTFLMDGIFVFLVPDVSLR